MKKHYIKHSLGLIKKIFMGLFINIVNASKHTKCVLLSNQTLLIYIIMKTVKNFTTIHFPLN